MMSNAFAGSSWLVGLPAPVPESPGRRARRLPGFGDGDRSARRRAGRPHLHRSPGLEEHTTVSWHQDEEVLRLDHPDFGRRLHDAPLCPATPREPLTLTAFLDRPIVEAFANRRAALTGRIYPTSSYSTSVQLLATGARVRARSRSSDVPATERILATHAPTRPKAKTTTAKSSMVPPSLRL